MADLCWYHSTADGEDSRVTHRFFLLYVAIELILTSVSIAEERFRALFCAPLSEQNRR